MAETKAERVSRLSDEIGYALERGVIEENKLAALRFWWDQIPDTEKDGLSMAFKSIESMVRNLRIENSVAAGAGKMRRVKVTTGRVVGE